MFNRESLKAIILSSMLLAAGLLFLVWQYNRIAESRIPQIEREIETQKQELEKQKAKSVVISLMEARLGGNEEQARQWLTERAVQQSAEGEFELAGDFEKFQVVQEEQLEEETFRFQVKVERQRLDLIEILEVRKILGQYYVDSVQVAG